MKLSLSILISLSFAFSVYAQEYRLNEPLPQDYVDNVQKIIELADAEYVYRESFNIDLFAEVSVMEDEINWRYVDEDRLTYDQLATIYQAYETEGESRSMSDSTPPGKHWLKRMVELWMEENSINLDEVSAFEMGNYRIKVQPLVTSLNEYGGVRWGYFLQLSAGIGHSTENFVAIPTDDGYVIPGLPASIDSYLLKSGDLNNDDKPDIAYIHSDHIGNSYNSGGMIIASLQADNHFEKTSSLGYFQGGYEFPPSNYNWWFTGIGDGKTSVIQNQKLGSNWDCNFVETKLFAWITTIIW